MLADQVIFKDSHILRGDFAVFSGEKGFYLANLKRANPVEVDGRSVSDDSVWLRNGSLVVCHRERFHIRWEDKTSSRDGPGYSGTPESAPGELR